MQTRHSRAEKVLSNHLQILHLKYVCDGGVPYENICYTLTVYRP